MYDNKYPVSIQQSSHLGIHVYPHLGIYRKLDTRRYRLAPNECYMVAVV